MLGGSARSQQYDSAINAFSPTELKVRIPIPNSRSKRVTGSFQETSYCLYLARIFKGLSCLDENNSGGAILFRYRQLLILGQESIPASLNGMGCTRDQGTGHPRTSGKRSNMRCIPELGQSPGSDQELGTSVRLFHIRLPECLVERIVARAKEHGNTAAGEVRQVLWDEFGEERGTPRGRL